MLRILDKNKVPVKGLKKYTDLCIESALKLDDRTLSFSAPYRNIRNAIENEGYIETKDDRYVVKEIEKTSGGTAKIRAQLDLESLEGKAFREFRSEEQTIRNALQLAFAGTGWTIGICEVSKKRTLSMSNASALDVLKQALKTYRCEITINSKDQIIHIYTSVGEDKGCYFSNQLNLTKLTVQSTSYDFYTEIEPYGKDGLTIESVNDGKTYLENHQYSSKVKRCIWKDERYTVPESLKEDAEAKLKDMSKPYVSYSANVIDLAKHSEKYSILEYDIGDTVTLLDDLTDTREEQRIVGMKIYPDAPEKNSCTLANKVLTFDELAQKYEDTANTVDNITNDNGQIDGDTIDGIYSRQVIDLEDGIINSVYIQELNTKYVQVSGKLDAVEIETGSIKGNVAEFEETYTKRLEAAEADIKTIRTTDFSAVYGKIDILNSLYANLKVILSGSAGIGDLQNIHLTSDNAVIDTALIRTAVMESVSISDLLAGTISTNKFKIMSDDGGIQISGATQQWKDINGVVRMQAGRDAQGNFTFALFDETGKGTLIDSTGVQPGAIADGLIVNEMVSDTANIAASKLNIDSLFTAINDSTQVIKSNRIWLDDSGQSLNQAYTKMTQNITEIEQTAGSASDSASAAADAAKKALETLSGISTLDAMSASLNNDAHVVHTYTDGSGGDYSSCYTVFSVFLGDTDVSDHIDEIHATASDGITGTWNPQLRRYQVTAMSTDSGYVDISALYGLEGKVLLVGEKGLVIGGKALIVKSMGSWITKRFSVSKAKDGKIGLSYDLRVSTQIIRKQKDDKTLEPANVTFSAYKNDNGSVSSYSGKFQIEESKDSGKTYEIKYGSSSAELLTVYVPSSPDVNIIRCSLYDTSGVQLLDTQTVSIISDAAGLAQDIAAVDQKAQEAKEAIQTTSQEVTEIKSGMEGFETKLSKTTTDLQGVTDGTLLYNTKCQDNGDGTTTVSAALYKAGVEVTKEYPAAWFSWSRRTEQGEAFLQYGYSVTVNNDDYMFGGVVIGQFIRYVQMALTVGDKLLVIGNKAMCVNVDA